MYSLNINLNFYKIEHILPFLQVIHLHSNYGEITTHLEDKPRCLLGCFLEISNSSSVQQSMAIFLSFDFTMFPDYCSTCTFAVTSALGNAKTCKSPKGMILGNAVTKVFSHLFLGK